MALTPWVHPAVIMEYVHTTAVRFRRQFRGHTRHPGDARAIIRACIDDCWNGRFFTASPGHFDMFWTRDLSFSTPSLIRTGEQERVHASLAYALRIWTKRRSHITTTIHYFDRPGDVFEYGVDSLPLFLAALRAADATDLVERYRPWLEDEIAHFDERVVDPASGLVRGDRKYSAHRDTVWNRSNTFGNSMVALLAKTITETGWFESPFERHFDGAYGRLLVENLWQGDHFRDAIDDPTVSGEANVWPFYTGAVSDPAYVRPALRYLHEQGFTDPLPLRYELERRPDKEVFLTRLLLPDYQGSTVWTSLGAIYLQLLRQIDPELLATETARYVEFIERDGTFWEVLGHDGQNWVSPRWLFIGEESMLWSAIFLDLLENPNAEPALLSPALHAEAVAPPPVPDEEEPAA